MIRLLAGTLMALAALTSPLLAQDDRWQITLEHDQYVWDVRLVRLDGDSLFVRQSDSLIGVPVNRMAEMRLIRKSEVQLGASDAAGTMSALTGGDDEVYDLATLEQADRLRMVQKILLMHPTGP
jgi:hypothetical protein